MTEYHADYKLKQRCVLIIYYGIAYQVITTVAPRVALCAACDAMLSMCHVHCAMHYVKVLCAKCHALRANSRCPLAICHTHFIGNRLTAMEQKKIVDQLAYLVSLSQHSQSYWPLDTNYIKLINEEVHRWRKKVGEVGSNKLKEQLTTVISLVAIGAHKRWVFINFGGLCG